MQSQARGLRLGSPGRLRRGGHHPDPTAASDPDGADAPAEPFAPGVAGATGVEHLLLLGALTGSVLNTLRDALTAVMGFAQLLEGEVAVASPPGRYARHIRSAGERGKRVLDCLAWHLGGGEAQRAHTDLRHVVERVVDLARPLLGPGVRVVVEHGAGGAGGLEVGFDPDLLAEVLLAVLFASRARLRGGGRLLLRTGGEDVPAEAGKATANWACVTVCSGEGCGPTSPAAAAHVSLGLPHLDACVRARGAEVLGWRIHGLGQRLQLRLPRTGTA